MGLLVFGWMRPPITYALMPFLVGLPLCASGTATIEMFSISVSLICFLYLLRKKRKQRFLMYRRVVGMLLGIGLVLICNNKQVDEINVVQGEEGLSEIWKTMPKRELVISMRIIERSTITTINEKSYDIYEGYIMSAPKIRIDLLGKKASWIEKYIKRQKEILKGDIVSLIGVIAHRERTLLDGVNKNLNEEYTINHVVVRRVEHKTGFYSNLKHKIYISLISNNSEEEKYPGFVYALLMGDRSLLRLDQVRLFKETGTMHLFAVSGLHVGIVYLICSFILRSIFTHRIIWITGSLLFVLVYVGLVGYADSACRAFIMISMWQFTKLLYKKGNPVSALYWASIILLIITPHSIFSLGFQLSFTVVLNILFCLDKSFVVKKFNLYKYFRSSFLISYSSFCGSSLLMIDSFHFINPLSIFINVILVNIIFIVFIFCLLHITIAITLDSQFLAGIIETGHFLLEFSLNLLNQITLFQFRFPGTFDIPNFIHLIYPLILIFLMPYIKRLWHKVVILSCLPITFLVGSIYIN